MAKTFSNKSFSAKTFSAKTFSGKSFGNAAQWLNGTISGNEFVDVSGHGLNADIINNDISLTSGFPYKSAALIAQKAANYGKIPDVNNFWFTTAGVPNQIPVVSLFQNIDYANQIFTRHVAQVLDGNGVETTEPYVAEIVTYNTVLSGTDLTTANTYFSVPAIDATAKWVDILNGSDTTGTGTQALPWKTLQKADTSAASGLKIYIKTGSFTEAISPGATYMYIQTAHAWVGLGFVQFNTPATGARTVLFVGTSVKSFTGIIFDGTASSSANIEAFSGSTNNTLTRCKFQNTNLYNRNQATSVVNYNQCVFVVGSKASIFRLDSTLSVTNSFFSATLSYSIDDSVSSSYSNYSYCKFIISNAGVALLKPSVSGATYNWTYNTFTLSGVNPILALSGGSSYTSVTFNYNTVTSNTITSNIMFRILGVGKPVTIQHNNVNLTNTTLNNSVFDIREESTLDFSYNYITTVSTNDCPHIMATNGSGNTTTSCNISYNTLSSKSLTGHVLIVGAESTGAGDNKINNGTCIGNKIYGYRYYDNSQVPTTHGLFIGFQKDWIIKYNYVNGTGINIIVKGTSTNTWTTGYIMYNLSVNATLNNYYSKAISGVLFYGNTSYNSINTGSTWYHFEFSINTGGDGASNSITKNNIIVEVSANTFSKLISYDDALSASGAVSNNNIMYSLAGSYGRDVSGSYTFAQWQALGYDANSLNQNVPFNSVASEQFWPITPVANGATLGSPYDIGLDITTAWLNSTTTNTPIVNKSQSGTYQNGAYVQ